MKYLCCFVVVLLTALLIPHSAAAVEYQPTDGFVQSIEVLSSLDDRSTGTPGNETAASYIKKRFHHLGVKIIGTHLFAVPVIRHVRSTLTLPESDRSISIQAIMGNAVTPQTIPPPGMKAPLVYVGAGELKHFNGTDIAGAIVLMELDSGKNWQHAAYLGAKALIYIDRGNTSKILLAEKYELSPIQFPRFWIPLADLQALFGPFENPPRGKVAEQVDLISETGWHNATVENIYGIIPGTDPDLRQEILMIEAFYDSTAGVMGQSPGADEACSIATLLELIAFFKNHPPQRTIMFVASTGHAQTLAGMREFIWSLTCKSKTINRMTENLQEMIVKTHKTIAGLNDRSFKSVVAGGSETDPSVKLVIAALQERIKTEADAVSRRLMQLRLQKNARTQQDLISSLAQQRQNLRRLLWRTSYADDELSEEEGILLNRIIPKTIADQEAIHADARLQHTLLASTGDLRKMMEGYELAATVSLHLSSHGDGLGAFNYGWLYPFRPRINRVSSYRVLDEVLRDAIVKIEPQTGLAGMFKDTLRPSQIRSWQSYFIDRPPLGGEVSALAGYHGLTLATTNDARSMWGTPYDTLDKMNMPFAEKQSALVCRLIEHLARAPKLHDGTYPRKGFSAVRGRAKFLRHGELFADQPAPGTVLLAYQGPGHFYVMVDHMGRFHLKGVADSKHSYHKVILEGYKFDDPTGNVIWTIDKKQTKKDAYRVKMRRRTMETDLIMFACNGTTLFNLLEPRTYNYLTKTSVIDGRRETEPAHYFYSRLDTWKSTISTVFLEPGTPLKMTLSDSLLYKKLILLNNSSDNPEGNGYMVDKWPFLHRTGYLVARDMWTLLTPRIENLEARGIYNERIHNLQFKGIEALKSAQDAWRKKEYDRFIEAGSQSWAMANRVYDDVEKTQKDVLYGVLFYIALFVPFAFCLERLLFSYTNIYKRILTFSAVLVLLIAVIYNVHPAFQLAYSPLVVILAFLIMGLSLVVTLIIFFRFEEEMTQLQSRAKLVQSDEIGKWKAFVAAFLLGVSNLRRRRLRTALTCITLIILTFTIMSFTSAKSIRRHVRLLYGNNAPYQGFLLKNVNWRSLPSEAFAMISNSFTDRGSAAPRVWLQDEDQTRTTRIPIQHGTHVFEAQGMVGLSHLESDVTEIDKILVSGRWLTAADRQVVLLPERMARSMSIDTARPDGAVVSIWGIPFEVIGIFSGAKLQEHRDLDGEILTPVTFPREMSGQMTQAVVEAMESGDDVREFQSRYQHTPGSLTVIVPFQTLLAVGGHLKGVAVLPHELASVQATARELVDRFGLSLFSGERSGTYLYHASDAMSYSGVPNIMIPILISIFIVLNTMISSVYERKREIGIYTSVGLAPSHVSFLFIAEAMAFAVLSVVFGYLVAQTTAKLFSGTALWSGITVNYSSIAGVGAMILVILVVMVSVIYPSRVAGEIAIPDVNRSWTLPPARGNELEITLPFLMTYREHRSVGGFLYEYFESHQDITHGKFSTADIAFTLICENPPGMAGKETDCPEGECELDACLHLTSRVWLAPFDFGIMQSVSLRFKPAQDDSGFLEVEIKLIRESGEANAWRRINKTFLHEIRKQLLLWRTFDNTKKKHYEAYLIEAEIKLDLRSAKDIAV